MKQLNTIILLAGALGLSACVSTPQRCPLGVDDGVCASMTETYEAARGGMGTRDSVFPSAQPEPESTKGFGLGNGEMTGKTVDTSQAKMAVGGQHIDLSQAGQHRLGGPVYHPAKPYRIWVAPWTDANGLIHSGEYMYFVTPGYWAYGPMELPGAAGGVLRPAVPDAYGFKPVSPQEAEAREANVTNGIVRPSQRIGQ